MKIMLRTLLALGMITAVAATGFAGGSTEVGFINELEVELQENGFTAAEAQEIAAAAREYDWSGTSVSDASLVARVVAEVHTEADLNADEAAQLARAVAMDADVLSGNGHSESEVAEVTLSAVSDLQRQIQEWRDGDRSESLGETVRGTVSAPTTDAARSQSVDEDDSEDADDSPAEAGRDAASGARNR